MVAPLRWHELRPQARHQEGLAVSKVKEELPI